MVFGLSGCASMSANECLVSDWSAIGYEDGARGYTTDRFSQHRKACAKHGVAADFEAYKRGREEGLLEFCQPTRGYTLGVNGGRYNGVCSAEVEPEFVQAYNAGHQLYSLRAAVSSAESAIRARKGELEYAEDRIVAIGVELISAETTTKQRVDLLAEMKELSERTGELEAEIDFLVAEKARAEQDLQNCEQTLVAQGY
jgi:hypothetical protein